MTIPCIEGRPIGPFQTNPRLEFWSFTSCWLTTSYISVHELYCSKIILLLDCCQLSSSSGGWISTTRAIACLHHITILLTCTASRFTAFVPAHISSCLCILVQRYNAVYGCVSRCVFEKRRTHTYIFRCMYQAHVFLHLHLSIGYVSALSLTSQDWLPFNLLHRLDGGKGYQSMVRVCVKTGNASNESIWYHT